MIERIGLALIAFVLAALFASGLVASFIGGEPFLGVMGAIGCLMVVWVGGADLVPRLNESAGPASLRARPRKLEPFGRCRRPIVRPRHREPTRTLIDRRPYTAVERDDVARAPIPSCATSSHDPTGTDTPDTRSPRRRAAHDGSPMSNIQQVGDTVLANVERVIVGKHQEVRLALVALLCRGHLLIEDVPGTGKTMLAKAIARSLGCTLPADPVHARPPALRRHRPLDLQPEDPGVRVPARARS